MAVRRIVANIASEHPEAGRAFYRDVLGLQVVMDLGWVVTLAGPGLAPPQISIASEGGSGTAVPDLSIEVDDLDVILARATAAGHGPVYGPVEEPWGVRRFFLRDPYGRLLNILAHG